MNSSNSGFRRLWTRSDPARIASTDCQDTFIICLIAVDFENASGIFRAGVFFDESTL